MFGIGTGISTVRSLAGIYRELRRLRRLAESYFRHVGVPLPETPYERFKSAIVAAGHGLGSELEVHQPEFDEEREAREKSEQIVRDIAAGRDPGTEYRPW